VAARPDGIGNTWINWYVTLLEAHLRECASGQKETEMAR
jgi:hypothetical protein